MSDTNLKDVQNTIKWANELTESWVGTTTGNVIRAKKEHLESLVAFGDMNLASIQVLELVEACQYAQKELNGY